MTGRRSDADSPARARSTAPVAGRSPQEVVASVSPALQAPMARAAANVRRQSARSSPPSPPLVALTIAGSLVLAGAACAGVPRKGSFGARLGSHSMLYLNSAPAQQRAMFIAA